MNRSFEESSVDALRTSELEYVTVEEESEEPRVAERESDFDSAPVASISEPAVEDQDQVEDVRKDQEDVVELTDDDSNDKEER